MNKGKGMDPEKGGEFESPSGTQTLDRLDLRLTGSSVSFRLRPSVWEE